MFQWNSLLLSLILQVKFYLSYPPIFGLCEYRSVPLGISGSSDITQVVIEFLFCNLYVIETLLCNLDDDKIYIDNIGCSLSP